MSAWNAEELAGGFEINAIERCLSKSPRRRTGTKSEKMAKTTKRRRGTRPKSNAQLICDSRDESTDKEKRNK